MILIRKFQPGDFAGVIEIEHEQFSEHDPYLYMSLYELNMDTFFVAEDQGTVVGFVAGVTAQVWCVRQGLFDSGARSVPGAWCRYAVDERRC